MNILQVTLGFYPAAAWGGPVKYVYKLGRELAQRGHRICVYCTNLLDKKHAIQPGTFETKMDGMRVVYHNTWHLPWWPGTLGPVWLPGLQEYLKREIEGFDVIHLHGYRSFMFVPISQAARRLQIPFVVQPHGTMPVIMNSFATKRLYDRLLGSLELEGLGALVALHEQEKRQAVAFHIPEDKIVVIPIGPDIREVENSPKLGGFRRRYGIPSDRRVILFLGRINRKKGTDMLVEAFSRLCTPNVFLVIAGPDDGQLGEVQGLIRKFGLQDRVLLPGLLHGVDVLAAYRDADLFVLPCRADTFPSTVIEACMADLPMAITSGCEIAPLIDGKVGEVVGFDAASFALAIDRLLSDQELYTRYRSNCKEVVKSLPSHQATVDRIEEVYQRLILKA